MDKRAIAALLKRKSAVRLDLGCGYDKQEGFIGVDVRKTPAVDIKIDLFKFPWPLPANIASNVVMSHFWEHIPPPLTLPFMQELHRICKHNCIIFAAGPYANGFRYVQDPTHCNPSNQATWDYWDPLAPAGLWGVYRPSPFHVMAYDLVPVAGDRDFNVTLKCCKKSKIEYKDGLPYFSCSHLRAKKRP